MNALTIASSIELYDNFSGVFTSMTSAMNLMLSGIDEVQSAMDSGINTNSFEASRESLRQAEIAAQAFQEELEKIKESSNNIPPATVPPAEAPIEWTNNEMPIFDTSGVERFNQEINSANNMLNTLSSTQASINSNAINVLPPEAISDLTTMDSRLNAIQQKIAQIESNPMNMGSAEANNELENLRGLLNQAVQEQNQLNAAVNNMDVRAANEAYSKLSRTVQTTERYIRDNTTAQGQFNSTLNSGTRSAGKLMSSIKSMIGAYIGVQGIRMGVNFYKEAIEGANLQTEAETKLETVMRQRMGATNEEINSVKRLAFEQQELGIIGDEVQLAGAQQLSTFLNSTEALNTLIPAMDNLAAQQNGVNATSQDMVSIGNLMGKVMQGQTSALTRVGVTFTEAQENVLKYGNEQERAAMLAQVITDNVGEMNAALANTPEGQIKQISNTWGDMKEVIGAQLRPAVVDLFSTINANLPTMEPLIVGITSAAITIVKIISMILGVAGRVASIFSDNWSIIAPIVWGIAAAMGAYLVVAGIVAVINGITAISEGVKAAAQMMATGATLAETAAQHGLNAALAACPLTWIILLIIALIAIIFAVCAAIAKCRDDVDSAFGVICGVISMACAFVWNTIVGVINSILQFLWTYFVEPFIGIIEWILNVCNGGFDSFGDAVANLIGQIISWFLSLGKVVTKIIDAIFGTDWTSGLNSLQDSVLAWGKNENAITLSREAPELPLQRIEYGAAWDAGVEFGDKVSNKISDGIDGLKDMVDDLLNPTTDSGEDALNGIKDNTDDIKKEVKNSDDILSMIKDSISKERIASYTTKQISVDMSGMSNKIASSLSIGDVVREFEERIAAAASASAEGV